MPTNINNNDLYKKATFVILEFLGVTSKALGILKAATFSKGNAGKMEAIFIVATILENNPKMLASLVKNKKQLLLFSDKIGLKEPLMEVLENKQGQRFKPER